MTCDTLQEEILSELPAPAACDCPDTAIAKAIDMAARLHAEREARARSHAFHTLLRGFGAGRPASGPGGGLRKLPVVTFIDTKGCVQIWSSDVRRIKVRRARPGVTSDGGSVSC